MATRKYLTDDLCAQQPHETIVERELIIKILPRISTLWEGTAGHLLDERLIPKKFEWPRGRLATSWEIGGFSYWLHRTRAPGAKGPISTWINGDWWMLQRGLIEDRGKGFATANLYEARLAYERELWRQTPAARVQWTRYCMAQEHEEFQTFLKQATGELTSVRQSRSK